MEDGPRSAADLAARVDRIYPCDDRVDRAAPESASTTIRSEANPAIGTLNSELFRLEIFILATRRV